MVYVGRLGQPSPQRHRARRRDRIGAAPVTRSSGQTRGLYFRWNANTRARKAINSFAHTHECKASGPPRSTPTPEHEGNATPTPPASSPAPGSA